MQLCGLYSKFTLRAQQLGTLEAGALWFDWQHPHRIRLAEKLDFLGIGYVERVFLIDVFD